MRVISIYAERDIYSLLNKAVIKSLKVIGRTRENLSLERAAGTFAPVTLYIEARIFRA